MLTHFLRYEPVAAAVGGAAAGGTLLEVGSGSRGIAPYLDGPWEITSCDMSFDDYGWERAAAGTGATRVTGSVLDLPFGDRSFDVVVASDLLEHVAAPDRAQALRELARVARRACVVGCPCGPHALRTDALLRRMRLRHGLGSPPWLDEHLDHGFPDLRLLADTLAPFGEVRFVANTNALARLLLARAEISRAGDRASRALFARLAPAVTRRGWRRRRAALVGRVLRGFDLPPVYRQIAVLRRA